MTFGNNNTNPVIHDNFEFVRGNNFLHKDLIIPQNKHHEANDLLGSYRILFEPYILPASKNAKVSLRCRTSDPAFNEILNLARKIEGCPVYERKKNGETASIWIYRMGPANGRTVYEIAHNFVAEEHKWFTDFIQPLKEILEKYPVK